MVPAAEPRSGATRRNRPEENVLYGVVRQELETFLTRAQARERPVPRFVERELRGFLRCGILAHGFVRVHCDGCGLDRVLAFSCKGRGFCPSCGGRRMADTAAHLVDRVLPEVPVRQWVLSLPFATRYRLAYDAPLTSAVLGLFVRAVFASLRRRARKHRGVARGKCGAVTFVQRFGDALNLNVHFHSLLLDGVYAAGPNGALRFHPLPPPGDSEVARVAGQVARRIARLLERRGIHGMRSLQAVLTNDFGLDLTGWTLEVAFGISDDGRIIVGSGQNDNAQHGWIAVIPEPSTALLPAVGLTATAVGRRRRAQ